MDMGPYHSPNIHDDDNDLAPSARRQASAQDKGLLRRVTRRSIGIRLWSQTKSPHFPT
jgi:hypothetical protein